MQIPINLVFEDELSEYVLFKVLSHFENKFSISTSYNGRGFGYIKSKINGFNEAAKAVPFLVLTDLDNSTCPPSLVNEWFRNEVHPNMIFQVAIREVESWIISDVEGFSKFLGISTSVFPRIPEEEHDPKQKLIQLAKRSKKRNIKEDIVPINNNAKIGPNYNNCLGAFIIENWNMERAMQRSESLRRLFRKLSDFTFTFPN